MMPYTTIRALGQDRLDQLHRQAQRDALARADRRPARPAAALLATVVRWTSRSKARYVG